MDDEMRQTERYKRMMEDLERRTDPELSGEDLLIETMNNVQAGPGFTAIQAMRASLKSAQDLYQAFGNGSTAHAHLYEQIEVAESLRKMEEAITAMMETWIELNIRLKDCRCVKCMASVADLN